ncbi:hypothetical protein ACOMHN_036050 [Nucella lapillus]
MLCFSPSSGEDYEVVQGSSALNLPGYSSGRHPLGSERIHRKVLRRYHWEKVKQDPERHEKTKRLNNEAVKRYQARKKMERVQARQSQ